VSAGEPRRRAVGAGPAVSIGALRPPRGGRAAGRTTPRAGSGVGRWGFAAEAPHGGERPEAWASELAAVGKRCSHRAAAAGSLLCEAGRRSLAGSGGRGRRMGRAARVSTSTGQLLPGCGRGRWNPGAFEAGAAGAASARNARLAQRAAPRRRCGNRGRREAHRAPGSRAQARAAAHARARGRAGGHGHVARACRRSAGRSARQRATLAGYPPCAQCAKRSAVRASDGACGRGCGWDAWARARAAGLAAGTRQHARAAGRAAARARAAGQRQGARRDPASGRARQRSRLRAAARS